LVLRERAVHGFSCSRGNAEFVPYFHPCQDRQAVSDVIYTVRFRGDCFGGERDAAHLQCAIEGPKHSPTGGGNDEIDRKGKVRCVVELVMVLDGPVHPEVHDRSRLQTSAPVEAFDLLDGGF
jgi:hypothetical protein